MSNARHDANSRSRAFTWGDPAQLDRAIRTMNGLEFFRAIIAGGLPPPPIADLVGMAMTEAENGRIVFEFDPGEFHYNPIGGVHGGIPCTLLDSAMGCSVQSTLDAGWVFTTLELKVNFVRPITVETGHMRCEGKVIHAGRRIATADGTLVDAHGKLYAHGSTTCLVFKLDA